MKFVPLKVRDCDGESRYVIAIVFKDDKGRIKQDLSRDTVLDVLAKSFKISDECAAKILEKADAGFARLEDGVGSLVHQPFEDTSGSTEFDLG